MCGLPGAGKTTLAKQLEANLPALRLAEDEWVLRLFPPDAPNDDTVRVPIKHVQWDLAVRAIQLGSHVVLDWGVWSLEERSDYRARCSPGDPARAALPRCAVRGVGAPAGAAQRGAAANNVPGDRRRVAGVPALLPAADS
jgi:predicted kinase